MAKKRGKKGKSKRSKKDKAKRQKFISKISKDGKISKKEGKKAAKKGISLRKIKNKRISAHREATREYNRSGRPGGYKAPSGRPQYEPLKIKRGALQADDRRRFEGLSRSSSKSRSKPKTRSSSSSKPTTNYASEAEDLLSSYDDQLAGMMDGGQEMIDPITFQYAASSLVEPGNNLTIGAATDAEKTSSTDKFKRRRKKRTGNRLLSQIKKQRSSFGGFTGPASTAASAPTAASTFGNI